MSESTGKAQGTQQANTVADVMRPALTTVEENAHVAAAAYLMKHNNATAIVVLENEKNRQPIGIITEADILRLVADGQDVNELRIRDVMTSEPMVCDQTTSIPQAARYMNAGGFRHLPVVDDSGLVGIVDITDISKALLDPPA